MFIISYDITSDERRNDVAKCLLRWGKRLQYSVFEALLSEVQLAELEAEVDSAINHAEDQVLVIDLGDADGRGADCVESIGKPYTKPVRKALVV